MFTVHHLNQSRSFRIIWLLEELGLEYDIKKYERDPKTMLAPASLKAVHPLGLAPVVTGEGLMLAESGAIVETLVRKYGGGVGGSSRARLAPAQDDPAYERYNYWMHYAEGSAMPLLLLRLIFDKVRSAPLPFFLKPVSKGIVAKVEDAFIEPQLKTHLDFMEAELAKAPWFAGEEFSAADIQMSFPLEMATARAGLDASRPRLMDWLRRIHARPAYARALARGGR